MATGERSAEASGDADHRYADFLALLSHELRNPLAAICAALELWRTLEPTDPALQHAREVAERQARNMAHLLDNLLTVAHVTRGTVRSAVEDGPAQKSGRTVSRRILVVDDNEDAAEMMTALLQIEGHHVRTALTGQAALDIAIKHRPEVALVDIAMPGMDGFELARHFRQQTSLPDMMLVALTGYGQKNDFEKSRQAGFDHHLVKPVDIDALRRILNGGFPRSLSNPAGQTG